MDAYCACARNGTSSSRRAPVRSGPGWSGASGPAGSTRRPASRSVGHNGGPVLPGCGPGSDEVQMDVAL
jgi:hypothetical protein